MGMLFSVLAVVVAAPWLLGCQWPQGSPMPSCASPPTPSLCLAATRQLCQGIVIGFDFHRAEGAELPGTTGGLQPLPRLATPMSSWCWWCSNGIGEGKGSELDWICRAEEQSGRAEGITSQRKRKEDSNEECSRQVNGLRCGSLSQAGFQENSNFPGLYLR